VARGISLTVYGQPRDCPLSREAERLARCAAEEPADV
jgi:hypothetical protein